MVIVEGPQTLNNEYTYVNVVWIYKLQNELLEDILKLQELPNQFTHWIAISEVFLLWLYEIKAHDTEVKHILLYFKNKCAYDRM